ncbi:GerAB/ArcD/ProY family transporter [Bacillus sp. mrc49]|uniref:GerAB/ArcD/ProY family transporter n=1 Tax=Bacillus sp. mrc49 TaxID=2054913 RepID=UPI000C271CAE|nr:endospore germination permease [Bacillus sp. mrc49]PJN88634.1 spore gernimation protein [Bacillus sp. mrc49]
MEKGKISSLQMAFMLYPTIVATAILGIPSVTAKFANTDFWISPIFASFLGYLTVYLAVKLHKLYPGQTIIQYSEQIVGRWIGKIVGFLFLSFYIQVTGLIVREYAEFVVDSFLINTPIIVVMASMVLLCAFVVHGGLEGLGRAALLFIPVFLIPQIILFILVFPDLEFKNIFPVLAKGVMPPLKGSIVPGGWYTEFFLISFLLPFLVDKKKGMRYGMMTVFAVMATLVIVNLIVLFVLGATTPSKVYPLMNVARYISFADFFEHMESFIMAIWVVGAFVKISVFFYATALGTAQWLNISDYRPIVWPLGILIVITGFWSISNSMDLERYNVNAFPFYGTLIQTLIPLLLLLIAIIGNKNKKSKKSNTS